MGRWSQRTRCGGGQSINFMVSSVFDDSDTIIVDFLTPTGLAALTLGMFLTKPNNDAPSAISLLGGNQVQLDFSVDVSAEDNLQMVGPAAGFVVPTTVAIS